MYQFRRVFLVLGLTLLLIACSDSAEEDYIDRMSDEHEGDQPVQNEASNLTQSAEVAGQEVTYATVNGNKITGYLAKLLNQPVRELL